jgi:hypothetical protein
MAEFRTTKGNRLDERAATVNRLLISDAEEAEVATTRIADDSSSLAEWLKYYIDIDSVHNVGRVKFKAFITKYQEQINTKYTDEMLGGNMEPVKKLDSVIRSVNLGWDLIASSEEEARNNLRRISMLVQMLHPSRHPEVDASYGTHEGAIAPYTLTHQLAVPGGTPIFKVRFLNLIGSPIQSWGPAATSGQLGYITNVSYNFETDFGFFKSTLGDGLEVYPKLIKFSCTFWPQNAHPPTFNDDYQHGGNRWWYWLNSPHGDPAYFSFNDIPEAPPPGPTPTPAATPNVGYDAKTQAVNGILQTDETPFLVQPRGPGEKPRQPDNPLNSQLASMRAQSQITKSQPTKATSTEHGAAARLGIINPGK